MICTISEHFTSNDWFQALFRVGVDPRIVNKEGKTADCYLDDDPQLVALYDGYGEGVWAAMEASDVQETDRQIKGTPLSIVVQMFSIAV